MRTAIFLGCISIASALEKSELPDRVVTFMVVMLLLFMVMDIFELIQKL